MKRDFLTEFNRVKQAIESGKTPVSNELRMAKTTLFEPNNGTGEQVYEMRKLYSL